MHKHYNISVCGAVQGTGFRPFLYRLAKELELVGYVQNTASGVHIAAQGGEEKLRQFLLRIPAEKPATAIISSLEHTESDCISFNDFNIIDSEATGHRTASVLPDLATCPDCLSELFDPQNRRYLYPFINCTHCGPRFSIITDIPYDRANTSMSEFNMCPACEKEYHDPESRRFHAQPNACPLCGPQLSLWDNESSPIAEKYDALSIAADSIRSGKILALKGIGGFQLICDARNKNAVAVLRARKHRPDKPFALMFPTILMAQSHCEINAAEAELLQSVAAPVVLLAKKTGALPDNIAPGNGRLGAMLPYSPLHHLLMRELDFPVVATSGNLTDEPICTSENEAVERLGSLADVFLVHNRAVVRPVDDSVATVVAGRPQILRRARGYAPLPVRVQAYAAPVLALGAHLKNTVAISNGHEIIVSQHIGDLETAPAFDAFKNTITDLQKLYDISPAAIACDLHPEYISSKYAHGLDIHAIKVQHHYAHVLACMADNCIEDDVMGICWDGTGYGTDHTLWGSEFLTINPSGFHRFGHFRYFPLAGGDLAVKQPRRSALGVLYTIYGLSLFKNRPPAIGQLFKSEEIQILAQMLEKNINVSQTCSAGRLFDAVASFTGLCQQLSFEGQAAIALENAIDHSETGYYSFLIKGGDPVEIDWQEMILTVITDIQSGTNVGTVAARFHNTLAEIALAVATRADRRNIMLTGGCFMNKYLTEKTVERLEQAGFNVFIHKNIPPNDGGIALGQVMAVARLKNIENTVHQKHKLETIK